MSTIWTANDVDFGNFHPVNADYGPRDIKAVAAMVNRQNIGQWALEFESDLLHDGAGMPYFSILATRGEDEPIKLTIESGVWIIKIWGELHVFKEGMFQRTFDVPKEQLLAARKAFRDKEVTEELEFQKERDEETSEREAEFNAKLKKAEESGDWSDLTKVEKMVLLARLKKDEELRVYAEAAKVRATQLKHLHTPIYEEPEDGVVQREGTFKPHVHIPISNLAKEVEESGIGPVHFGGIRQGESLTEYVERNQNQEDPNWQPEVSPALPEEPQLPMEDVWAENDDELTQQTTIVPAVGEIQVETHARKDHGLPENPHNTQGIDTP